MRRLILILLGFAVVAAAAVFFLLRRHTVEILHLVVTNAIVVKAPDEFPKDTIRQAFARALEVSSRTGLQEEYLSRIKLLFHRTERMQSLDPVEVEAILQDLQASFPE